MTKYILTILRTDEFCASCKCVLCFALRIGAMLVALVDVAMVTVYVYKLTLGLFTDRNIISIVYNQMKLISTVPINIAVPCTTIISTVKTNHFVKFF